MTAVLPVWKWNDTSTLWDETGSGDVPHGYDPDTDRTGGTPESPSAVKWHYGEMFDYDAACVTHDPRGGPAQSFASGSPNRDLVRARNKAIANSLPWPPPAWPGTYDGNTISVTGPWNASLLPNEYK